MSNVGSDTSISPSSQEQAAVQPQKETVAQIQEKEAVVQAQEKKVESASSPAVSPTVSPAASPAVVNAVESKSNDASPEPSNGSKKEVRDDYTDNSPLSAASLRRFTNAFGESRIQDRSMYDLQSLTMREWMPTISI